MDASPRTYEIRTYGCQMNAHDSERLAGLLEDAGYRAWPAAPTPDVRRVQHLRGPRERRQPAVRQPRPPAAGEERHPGHADRRRRLPGAEGPRPRSPSGRPGSTWCSAPTTSAPCRPCWNGPASARRPRSRSWRRWSTFPSVLPARRESAYAAWVAISVGCNNTCTFCIVPSLRGKEKDRRPGDILAEVRGAGRGRRHRGHAARAERQLLRGRVRGPGGVRQAAAQLRGDRRAGAGPVHLAAPARLHRRRDRGHGGDAERDAAPAHAAAVRLGHRAAGDAARLPAGPLPGHPGPGPRGDPGRGDHHRHHRRLPGRDRAGLRADPGRGAAGPVRGRVHVPVLTAARHPGRDHGRSGAARGRAGALRPAGRAGQRGHLGREQARWSAGPSRCWSPRARAARTPPPTACPAAPRDNRLVHFTRRGHRARARATWSR